MDETNETDVCAWGTGAGWKWLVSAFQGSAIAVKAELPETFTYTMEELPSKFRYCHFTNILFRPPNFFSFLPWPVEALGLLAEPGWMYSKELPFLRKPTDQLIEEFEKAWRPAPEEKKIVEATESDADRAVRDARARRAMAKSLLEGQPSGPSGLVK